MDYKVAYINPEIKLSCYEGKFYKTEAAFNDHLLVWLISGETKIICADKNFVFGQGSIEEESRPPFFQRRAAYYLSLHFGLPKLQITP